MFSTITYLKTYEPNFVLILIAFSGILPQIVRCLKEEQQNLKLYALTALDEIVKHNEDLANTVVKLPTLPQVIHFLQPNFTDVKIQVHYRDKCILNYIFYFNYYIYTISKFRNIKSK